MAKCYFAKHKLVWEVLEGGLKSKIEIQWSDIMALKANCPEDGPGTLSIVVILLVSYALFYLCYESQDDKVLTRVYMSPGNPFCVAAS